MRNYSFIALLTAAWIVLATVSFLLTSSAADAEDEAVIPKIAEGEITAAELAELLEISAWSFQYDTKLKNVWVEIVEGDKKTLVPFDPEGPARLFTAQNQALVARHRKPSGRIGLFIHRNRVVLRLTGTYSGGGIAAFQDDELWWGWGSYHAAIQKPSEGLPFKPGEQLTLLRYIVQNGDPAKSEQKVEVRLKVLLAD